jgi:hypothetical protein
MPSQLQFEQPSLNTVHLNSISTARQLRKAISANDIIN